MPVQPGIDPSTYGDMEDAFSALMPVGGAAKLGGQVADTLIPGVSKRLSDAVLKFAGRLTSGTPTHALTGEFKALMELAKGERTRKPDMLIKRLLERALEVPAVRKPKPTLPDPVMRRRGGETTRIERGPLDLLDTL